MQCFLKDVGPTILYIQTYSNFFLTLSDRNGMLACPVSPGFASIGIADARAYNSAAMATCS